MEKDIQIAEAFSNLQPLCVAVAKESTVDNIARLTNVLKSVPLQALQELQEYILFPLRVILKKGNGSNDLYEATSECIKKIVSCGSVSEFSLFADVFVQLCLILSQPGNTEKLADSSEELKLSVITCLRTLVANSTDSVLEKMYETSFLPALGHAVFITLQICGKEANRNLQYEAIQCLSHLAYCHKKGSVVLRNMAGSCFASFLPGISLCLSAIATADMRQGYKVIVTAISVWAKLISLVMSDKQIADKTHLESARHSQNEDDQYKEGKCLFVRRDAAWLKSTSEKLQLLFEKMTGLASHSNWRVRLALAEWSKLLLLSCSRSLEQCVSYFLNVLVSLSGDEYGNIASLSKETLKAFGDKNVTDEARTLTDVLEEELYGIATSLPRIMRVSDEAGKLLALRRLNGYISLLGSQVSKVLNSAPHLHRLSLALMQILEMDIGHISILEQTNLSDQSRSLHDKSVQTQMELVKHFKHFAEDSIHKELIKVCCLLGFYGDSDLLIDYFMDFFRDSLMYRLQAVWIINYIVLGTRGHNLNVEDLKPTCSDLTSLSSVISSLVDELIQDDYWHLPTVVSQFPTEISNSGFPCLTETSAELYKNTSINSEDIISIKDVNTNILLICLLLDAIGSCSKVLGEEFIISLINCLYAVLVKVGDSTAVISQSAYLCLHDIAHNCNYSNISDLIYENTDYLVNSISLRLRHLYLYPMAPVVLQIILQYGDAKVLPLVDDTIKEVLLNLDTHHGDDSVKFMKVLRTLIECVKKWYPVKSKEQSEKPTEVEKALFDSDLSTQSEKEAITADSVRDFFLDYHRQKRIAEDLLADDMLDDNEDLSADSASLQEFHDVDKPKEKPLHVKIIVEVLERCMHLLPSSDLQLKILVMDIIQASIRALQDHEDDLLPIVHKVWQPLVLRFGDKELQILTKAFETLLCLAEACGDFIRQRTVKEVWSRLVEFLKTQSFFSRKCESHYKLTLAYKLQLLVLRNVGRLCLRLNVQESDCDAVANVCLPYLSNKQPEALQQAAISSFKSLMELDADMIWLKLIVTYSPVKELIPPHSCFKSFKVNDGSQDINQYSANVSQLLALTDNL